MWLPVTGPGTLAALLIRSVGVVLPAVDWLVLAWWGDTLLTCLDVPCVDT